MEKGASREIVSMKKESVGEAERGEAERVGEAERGEVKS